MSEPISVVVLSTGLDNFKDIRKALTAEPRVKLLAGGNDTWPLGSPQSVLRAIDENPVMPLAAGRLGPNQLASVRPSRHVVGSGCRRR